jgi:uncharacterized protein YwqG
MVFVAQLNLREISQSAPDGAMPSIGSLLVFAALDEGGVPAGEQAVLASIVPDHGLRRASWPTRLNADLRFAPAEILAEPILTLPTVAPGLTEDAGTEWDALHELLTRLAPRHQILGHPRSHQELNEEFHYGGSWTLLLQIEEDGIAGFTFADGGRLHFWVNSADLAVGNLETCLVTIDSY